MLTNRVVPNNIISSRLISVASLHSYITSNSGGGQQRKQWRPPTQLEYDNRGASLSETSHHTREPAVPSLTHCNANVITIHSAKESSASFRVAVGVANIKKGGWSHTNGRERK